MLSLNKNSFYVTTAPPDVNRQLLQYKVYCSLFIALKRIGKIYITAIVFYLIRRFKRMRFVETIFVIMFYIIIHRRNNFIKILKFSACFIFEKKDSIAALSYRKPANYTQSDGREIHYYNNVMVILDPKTSEVITVNYYKEAMKSWKKL